MAGWLGVEVGEYMHVTDSMHLYLHEIERVNIDRDVTAAKNTDRLCESYDESMACFDELQKRMEQLIDARSKGRGNLPRRKETMPTTYENIWRILAADDARRYGEQELASQLAAECTNPALSQLWQRWCKRVSVLCKAHSRQ